MKSRKVLGLLAMCISLLGLQVAINGVAAATGTVTGTVFMMAQILVCRVL
jgi:hypothetical protein